MVDLPQRKVGIIACSGEELPEGTVTRLAALRVLEELRPDDTVTICLPLFLAGGEGDRAFARFYPTIAVDGCELRCAARATETYSNKPAASLVVSELSQENHLGPPQGRRKLNEAGMQAVELMAEQVAQRVDMLLGNSWSRREGGLIQLETIEEFHPGSGEQEIAPCACGSGIPTQKLIISGKEQVVVGMPLIFQQFLEAGKNPDVENMHELLAIIKIYNPISVEQEPDYLEAIRLAYTKYWFKEKDQ